MDNEKCSILVENSCSEKWPGAPTRSIGVYPQDFQTGDVQALRMTVESVSGRVLGYLEDWSVIREIKTGTQRGDPIDKARLYSCFLTLSLIW